MNTRHTRRRRLAQIATFTALTIAAFVVGAVLLPTIFAAGWGWIVGWIAAVVWITVISRRVTLAEAAHTATLHALRVQAMMISGECATPWRNGDAACLCVRPYGHTGPHTCGICEDIAR